MGLEILTAGVFAGAALAFFAAKPKERLSDPVVFGAVTGAVFFLAFTLRIYMGLTAQGFTTDIDTFKGWAMAVDRVGFREIYKQELFLDYPPGYLYVLRLLEKIRKLFSIAWESRQYTLIIKMPAILAYLVCAGGLLWLGKKRLGESLSLLAAAFYLFCPAVVINSAQWGQVDSVFAMVVLFSVYLLYKERYVPSAILYGVGLALKPQTLIFAPLYIFFAAKQRKYLKLLLGMLCTVATVLLIATPFTENFNYLWLLKEYRATLDSYNYYSVNAYNYWTVIGKNWTFLPEGTKGWMLNMAAPAGATLLCGGLIFGSKRKDAVFACPALLMTVMYLFGVKMHERYLYPAFLFLLAAFIFTGDRRLPKVFGVVSAVNFVNVYHVLHLFRTVGGNYDPNAFATRLLAFVQGVSLVGLLTVLYAVYVLGAPKELAEPQPWPERPSFRKTSWAQADTAAVVIVTVLYGCFAFWHLGGTKMPATMWTPAQGDSVVLTAQGPVDRISYLPGLAPDDSHWAARTGVNIQVETSEDGQSWEDCGNLSSSGTYVFDWAAHNLSAPGAYVRLTALDGNSVLGEVGLHLAGRSVFSPVEAPESGAALIDEQDTVPLTNTYENSAYFDEIYHARTAYEHLLGLEPYENTHPPLGKYLIGLGVLIFGMNPFGWRCVGVLFGVLMLPVLYHLLKQLFGKTSLCAAATLWFAFDFMHFTQTRIATIDTYAVFFMLLMFDTMVVFLKRDLMKDDFKRLLQPLLLCGIFTGLGIASKWTAAYAAVGLAVLFFGKAGLSLRDAWRAGEELAPLWGKVLRLCAWCCLFFIVIPFGLYFAAFLPVTALPHNVGDIWGNFWRYQVNMYNYHSQLVAEHYFASPWYEWPLDMRPIWFYTGTTAEGQYSTIASFGSPPVWWSGFLALFMAAGAWVRQRKTFAAVALGGFLSVFLPWTLVPRLTFIYHYFTAVPFLVIALAGAFETLSKRPLMGKVLRVNTPGGALLMETTVFSIVLWVVTAAVLVLFMVFFPVLSGAGTTRAYVAGLKWFPTWYF